jgi:hypothetical protein
MNAQIASLWIWLQPRNEDPVARARATLERISTRDEIPGLAHLYQDVRTFLDNRKVVIEALIRQRHESDVLIYAIVANRALASLRSGRLHLSHGVLGEEGCEVRAAYIAAATRLLERGLCDRVTYQADLAALDVEIAGTG